MSTPFHFTTLDWAIIAASIGISFLPALFFWRRASENSAICLVLFRTGILIYVSSYCPKAGKINIRSAGIIRLVMKRYSSLLILMRSMCVSRMQRNKYGSA